MHIHPKGDGEIQLGRTHTHTHTQTTECVILTFRMILFTSHLDTHTCATPTDSYYLSHIQTAVGAKKPYTEFTVYDMLLRQRHFYLHFRNEISLHNCTSYLGTMVHRSPRIHFSCEALSFSIFLINRIRSAIWFMITSLYFLPSPNASISLSHSARSLISFTTWKERATDEI